MPILGRDKALMLQADLPQERFQEASDNCWMRYPLDPGAIYPVTAREPLELSYP